VIGSEAGAQPLGVSVIIVNWNGRRWLESCLPALAGQSYREFEIIVVDNGSEDDSVAWLAEQWPGVRLLALPMNTGFAAANNRGIEAAGGLWIATLNNDTIVDPDWLANLVAAADEADVGMVASLVVFWDAPGRVDAAGIEVDKAGLAWNRGHGRPVEEVTEAPEVFGPNGAAGLYRKQMLVEIGAFDEDFFAYYEDVDLAWRARRAGWRCRYAPAAVVRHWHSATGGQFPWQKAYLISRNKLWTIFKNYDRRQFLVHLPLIVLTDFIAMAYRLATERNLASFRGRLAALRGVARMRAKRTPGGQAPLVPFGQAG